MQNRKQGSTFFDVWILTERNRCCQKHCRTFLGGFESTDDVNMPNEAGAAGGTEEGDNTTEVADAPAESECVKAKSKAKSAPANGAGGSPRGNQPHNRHHSASPQRPSSAGRANSNPKANQPLSSSGSRERVPGFNFRENNSVWSNKQREREREKERREREWERRGREKNKKGEQKWAALDDDQEMDLPDDRKPDFDAEDLDDEFGNLSLNDQGGGQHGRPPSPQLPFPPFPYLPGAEGSVPYNWQANKCSVKERLAYLFNSDIMSDVKFVVGKGAGSQRIPAHKFVLSIGSAVFDAMFNGAMATNQPEIELPDIESAAFLAMLKFLYTDEVNIGPDTVMTTLYTAKKYAVPALERACVDFLKRNLSSDNAFVLLTQARLFDEPQLAALCLETIDKNTTEALAAEGFTDIDLDTLCVVLERDTLGIRECKLFGALCRWAEAECHRQGLVVNSENQRSVLGRALTLIRFPLMTVEEFALGVAQSNILTDREVVQLFLYFTVNPKPAVGFMDTPRCCLTGKEQVVSRFLQIESRWGYSGTSDRIRFMVNRKIFVVGFGLYGSIHGPSEYITNVQIIHTDTGKVCGSSDTSFASDGSTSTFRVMFKEPVEIQPNTNYTACATLKGPDSYYGAKGLRKVTHESVSSGKVTFQFSYSAGNNNGTSVEDGQLPEIIFYT